MASSVVDSPVADTVDQLIADEELVFLRRQPRSTELIAVAGNTSQAGPRPTGRSPRRKPCG